VPQSLTPAAECRLPVIVPFSAFSGAWRVWSQSESVHPRHIYSRRECLYDKHHRPRLCHRRRWLRVLLRSRLNGQERAMPNSSNKLLASLSTSDFDLLEPHLEPVTLGIRKHLEKPNRRIDAAYFPESGFASVVAVQKNGKQVEVGLIGREGMTGLPIVFGNHRSPHATYVQAAGTGQCIPAEKLRSATRDSQSLRDSLLKSRRHSVYRRLTPQSATRSRGWTYAWRAGS
jgi:hypothetical protein